MTFLRQLFELPGQGSDFFSFFSLIFSCSRCWNHEVPNQSAKSLVVFLAPLLRNLGAAKRLVPSRLHRGKFWFYWKFLILSKPFGNLRLKIVSSLIAFIFMHHFAIGKQKWLQGTILFLLFELSKRLSELNLLLMNLRFCIICGLITAIDQC